jgi:UDP-3-O-[3-hydroxymyristoyl] glucosamine N-acyltransferase
VAVTLKDLAQAIDAELIGDGSLVISGANTLEDAGPEQVSFLSNPKYAPQLEQTKAAAVVVSKSTTSAHVALLKAADPYYAFSRAVVMLHGYRKHPHQGVSPRANVDPTATIGAGTIVYPGVFIGPRTRVGSNCIIYPNAVIYDDCVIGDRVIIHANATIGNDGYGFATHKGAHHKIPQVGNVVLGDDVEVGSNVTVDRAALGSTRIGAGSKIGPLVTIGHNVQIGEHALIVAQVGIAGSATVGHHVTMAGQAGIAGHINIGNNVIIGAQSGVTSNVPDQTTLLGSPAMPIRQTRRVTAVYVQLPELLNRVKQLEQQVEELGTPDEQSDGK